MALDYSVVKVDSFTVGDGHVVDGSWRVTPPSVYPPGFNASICGVSICGTPVALGTPSGQFGAVHATFLRVVGGVSSGQLFGTPKFQLRAPAGGVPSAQQFGVPTAKAKITRTVGAVSSAQAFGVPLIQSAGKTSVGGVSSAQQFGTITTRSATPAGAGGVPSAQAFGVVTAVSLSPPQTRTVSGPGSAQAFGAPTVKASLIRTVTGVGSAASFGTPTTRLTQQAGGVPSAQQFGVPRTRVTVTVGSVGSAQQLGTPAATTVQGVSVQGVGSAQQFGEPWIGHLWLTALDCLDSPYPAICDNLTLCGTVVCGGTPFDDPAFCLGPTIVNEFLVDDGHLVDGIPYVEVGLCLDSPLAAICDETTICGTVVCGGASFIEIPDWPPSPPIVDTFLCDQRLVGTGYVEPITVTRAIDLQPAGCV